MIFKEFLLIYPQVFSKAQIIYKGYQDKFIQLMDTCNSITCRKEYARGGLGMGLGYYWANPMKDRVVGGVHRGRLLKHINSRIKPDWEYCFDPNGKIVAAQEDLSNNPIMHFFLYDIDEYVWELVFDSNRELERISVVFFRNCLIELELVFTPHSFGEEEEIFMNSRYEAWIFEYLNQEIIEFEYFWDFLYPEKASDFLSKYGLNNQLIRKVFKKHTDDEGDSVKYDLFEINESTKECRFVMTQTLK
ncbi:MAG TPA: hypothetical protein PKA81_07615 [Clostridia bacterium]|nr:hypothetical protein [Clostridia bacterium]